MSRADRTGRWASIAVAAAAAAATFAVFAVLLANVNARAQTKVAVRGCSGETVELSGKEWEMVKLHNQARKDKGLGHLCVSKELTEAAGSHSNGMIEKGYFSHYGPKGDSTPRARIRKAGYESPAAYGENIALGSGEKAKAPDRFKALMHSDGHRKNILSDDYTQIGVGAESGDFNGIEGQTTVYTVDFGAKQGESGGHQRPEVIEETTSTTAKGTTAAGETTSPRLGEEPMMSETTADEGGSTTTARDQYQQGGDSREVAVPSDSGAQQSAVKDKICESFASARQDVIGDLLREAEEDSAVAGEVKRRIAEDFQNDLLNPSYCDFSPVAVEGEKEIGKAGDRAEAADGGDKRDSGDPSMFGESGIFGEDGLSSMFGGGE